MPPYGSVSVDFPWDLSLAYEYCFAWMLFNTFSPMPIMLERPIFAWIFTSSDNSLLYEKIMLEYLHLL